MLEKIHQTKERTYSVQFTCKEGLYQGKLLDGFHLLYASQSAPSARNVAMWTNRAIVRINAEREVRPKIPELIMKEIDAFVKQREQQKPPTQATKRVSAVKNIENSITPTFKEDKPMPTTKEEIQAKTETKTQTVNIKTQRKKVIPRKPFTPYGLQGYLVDKQGNIRLNLDRRANAQTIVLTAEMFTVLAEMVFKTQAQARN